MLNEYTISTTRLSASARGEDRRKSCRTGSSERHFCNSSSQRFKSSAVNFPGSNAIPAEVCARTGWRRPVSYVTERNVSNKIACGGFTAAFFLPCLEGIGVKNLQLDPFIQL